MREKMTAFIQTNGLLAEPRQAFELEVIGFNGERIQTRVIADTSRDANRYFYKHGWKDIRVIRNYFTKNEVPHVCIES